jgi:SAM-dependent methyltransferase
MNLKVRRNFLNYSLADRRGVSFICVACGARNVSLKGQGLDREGSGCKKCKITLRNRAQILGVMQALRIRNCEFSGVEEDWSRIGLGIGDDLSVAKLLPQKFFYTNSHIDRFPTLNLLTRNFDLHGSFEFISCSDVLEHIAGDPMPAIQELFDLLKPGGAIIVSVPLSYTNVHKEFYSDLVDWRPLDTGIAWTDKSGNTQIDDDPEWHGGDGLTLAFRLWSENSLRSHFMQAGFSSLEFIQPIRSLGVPSSDSPYLPLLARKD